MAPTDGTPATRTVLWRRTDIPGLEHVRLWEPGTGRDRADAEGPRLEGVVLALYDELPMRVEYEISCTPRWETRRVRVTLTHGARMRTMELVADNDRRWWDSGEELAAVAGCIDVDLSVSPATNTLPIRRASLRVGGARDVTAAWIRFPSLDVQPLTQRYTRVGEREYRYESGGGAFTAQIEVDDLGLVVRYPPAWERLAEADVRAP